jgi:hypothetical protein
MFFNALDPSNGLGDAAEELPLSLTINTPYQAVGQKAVYTLIGAPPGSPVYWSSYKDGQETGELNDSYGQTVGSNGTAKLEAADAWKDTQTGVWTKVALVQTPDGKNHTAMVQFRVSPAVAAGTTPTATPATTGNFFSDPLFNLGGFQVTGGMLVIGGVVAYFVFGKHR